MQQATAPPGVKRKLAAILSADVKGYSRLMAADEEGTLRTLNAYRQEMDALVAGRDGRIVGSAGDSVLAEFPSAVEAARCAVEIQEELAARNGELPKDRRLEFRIGINLGDVMVEGDDLFGDGVNVAARLQALAEPGGIYVSGGIYDQIKGKLPFGADFLGEQTVKNIAEPVRVYRLRSDRATLRRAVPRRWRTWSAIAAGVGLLVIVAAGTAWYFDLPRTYGPTEEEQASALPLPDRPSIAVLPFDNLSDDPEEEYFADGLTDDLITDLSKISGLFIIARNSVFAYKDQPLEVREVARELGVRYVLRGQRAPGGRAGADQRAADRRDHRRPCLGRALRTRLRRHLRGPGRGHPRDRWGIVGPADRIRADARSRGCPRAAWRRTTITCAPSRSSTARKGRLASFGLSSSMNMRSRWTTISPTRMPATPAPPPICGRAATTPPWRALWRARGFTTPPGERSR